MDRLLPAYCYLAFVFGSAFSAPEDLGSGDMVWGSLAGKAHPALCGDFAVRRTVGLCCLDSSTAA